MIIVYSDRHKLHHTVDLVTDGQPLVIEEVPQRVELILQALQSEHLGQIVPPQDLGLEPILAVHDPDYVHFLQEIYTIYAAWYGTPEPVLPQTFASRHPRRRPNHPVGQIGYYSFATFSPILAGTWEAAYWSAQCALTGAELLQEGERVAYAICRPPGHHAGADLYGGFCYLNNAAIAARFLGGRSAILDIDFHHGNGTQEIFYRDPKVLYCSIHAHPDQDYPYFWGMEDEVGEGPGEGYNLNVPLPLGTSDEAYLTALDRCLERISKFDPEYLIISLGLDFLAGDPVGGFNVSMDALSKIASRIASTNQAGCPALIVQEGGYNLPAIGKQAVTFLSAFA